MKLNAGSGSPKPTKPENKMKPARPSSVPRRRIQGVGYTLLTGLLWSLFSWWLAEAGHQPGGRSFFTAHYYVQSVILIPTMLLSWLIFSTFLGRCLSSAQSRERYRQTSTALGRILGGGYLLCWLLPDVVVYAIWGFDMLGKVVLFLPAATTLFVVWHTSQQLHRGYNFSRQKAVGYALVAWCLQAIPVLLFIR